MMFSERLIAMVAPTSRAVFEALAAGDARIYRSYLTATGRIKELTALTLIVNLAMLDVSVWAIATAV
ncbi:hypothetical protein L6303_06610 [archaeon]|nr:hypothetical protein [archaeon]